MKCSVVQVTIRVRLVFPSHRVGGYQQEGEVVLRKKGAGPIAVGATTNGELVCRATISMRLPSP